MPKQNSGFHFWQRLVSLLCVSVLIAPLFLRNPLQTKAAPEGGEKNLVVILVESSLFEPGIAGLSGLAAKIFRYAADVQKAMPESKTLILPVNKAESPGNIFAVLEKIYLEGRQNGSTLDRLSGVVLIGEVPLPSIRSDFADSVSIFPYTDFENPAYVWDKTEKVFVANGGSSEMQAEVYHGLVRAPGNAAKSESQWLGEYFDKNHRFHSDELPPPDKALFFADLIHEKQSQNPQYLKMYEAAETLFASDIAHFRYNLSLLTDAQELFTTSLEEQTDETPFRTKLRDMYGKYFSGGEGGTVSFPFSDSLTFDQIRQFLPHYSRVVSGYLSKTGPLTEGSGRWIADEESADTIPAFITEMDVFSKEFLREVTDATDAHIFQGFQQNIQYPVEVFDSSEFEKIGDSGDHERFLQNYFFGRISTDINRVEQCTFRFGSPQATPRAVGDNSQLVNLNHLWDRFAEELTHKDDDVCDQYGGCCPRKLNEPEVCNPDKATRPVFDPVGGELAKEGMRATDFRDCLRINPASVAYPGDDIKNITFKSHSIPSTILHNEPRKGTIKEALKDMISGAIPADEIHSVSFQGPGADLISISLPDFTAEKAFEGKSLSPEAVLAGIESDLKQLEDETRVKLLQSNLASYIGYIRSIPHEFFMEPNETFINAPPLPNDPLPPLPIRESLLGKYWRAEPYGGLPATWRARDLAFAGATKIVRAAFPDAATDTDAWIRYLESASPELKLSVEALFERGVSDPVGVYNVTPQTLAAFLAIPRPAPVSFAQFALQGGASLKTYNPLIPAHLGHTNEPEIRIYPPVINFPFKSDSSGFLTAGLDQALSTFDRPLFAEFAGWRNLTTDEKHRRVLELFFNSTTGGVPFGRANGYELGSIRANGDAGSLWWGGEDETTLPGDDEQFDAATEARLEGIRPGNAAEEALEEEIDECTGMPYNKGVPITEYAETIACWVQDIQEKPVEIEFSPICSYTGVLDGEDYNFMSEDWRNPGKPLIPAGSRITISGAEGGSLIANRPTTISLRFENAEGEVIRGGIRFSVTSSGSLSILDSGLQPISGTYSDTTFSGEISFQITAENGGEAGLTVTADGFSPVSRSFAPTESAQISLREIGRGETGTNQVELTLIDSGGGIFSSYNGFALGSLADTSAGYLLKKTIKITEGKGMAEVRLKPGASTTLAVTMTGFAPGEITLTSGEIKDAPTGPLQLYFRSLPQGVGFGETAEGEVGAKDREGNIVGVPEGTVVKATDATGELVNISPAANGRFTISGKDRVGMARLIAEAPGATPATGEVKVAMKLNADDIRNLHPNALIVSVLGSDFANFYADPDPIANAILFSDRPQAVISTLSGSRIPTPLVSVFGGGGMKSFEHGAKAEFSSLNPLTVRVTNTLKNTILTEYSLSLPESAVISAEFEPLSPDQQSGLYFSSLDRSGKFSGLVENGRLLLSYEGQKVLEADRNISLKIFDNRFSVEFESEDGQAVIAILKGGTKVGSIHPVGANIRLLTSPQGKIDFFSVPDNQDGSKGFSVSADGMVRATDSGSKALDNAAKTVAPGFNLDDNFALQLASGTSAGEAAKFNFGPTGVFLGDPTVSLAPDDTLIGGFDRGIGKEIARFTTDQIESATIINADNDSFPDILVSTTNGRGRLLKNLGNNQFRDAGEIVGEKRGFKKPAAADISADGFDDIVSITADQQLQIFRNDEERYSRENAPLFPQETRVTDLKTADFDQDGFPDLLVSELNGDIAVYWGSTAGYSRDQRTRLGNYGMKVEPGNLAKDNTLISTARLFDLTKKIVPLRLSAPARNQPGITTAAEALDAAGMSDTSDPDGLYTLLKQAYDKNPTGFEGDFSAADAAALRAIGMFAAPSAFSGLEVSLTLTDTNADTVQAGDPLRFDLTVKNTGNKSGHYSFAHTFNPAILIRKDSFALPADWPKGRAAPELVTPMPGQVQLLNATVYPGESFVFSFLAESAVNGEIEVMVRDNLSLTGAPADIYPDVTIAVPGLNGMLHFLNQGGRTFTESREDFGEEEIPEFLENMEDTDGDGMPDRFVAGENGENLKEITDPFTSAFETDTDGDGLVDAWDETDKGAENEDGIMGTFEDLGEISDEIMAYTKCDGGCLNIPINFAFLVPGSINIFEPLVQSVSGALKSVGGGAGGGAIPEGGPGISLAFTEEFTAFSSGITEAFSGITDKLSGITDSAGGAMSSISKALTKVREALGIPAGPVPGLPVFGLMKPPPFVCYGAACNQPLSFYRFYVSPTLTGGVGIGICTGSFPGFCMAFAPKKLNIEPLCELFEKKRGSSDVEDTGVCSLYGMKRRQQNLQNSAGGMKGLMMMLERVGGYLVSFDTSQNKRVVPFPWNWIYEQLAELEAMFALPEVTILYPDFSTVTKDSYKKRFSEAYDDIAAKGASVGESVTGAAEDAAGAARRLPEDIRSIFVTTERALEGEDVDWHAETSAAVKESFEFTRGIREKMKSFEDLYTAVSELPLIELEPVPVYMKVPYLSRPQIIALIDDLEKWVEGAEAEMAMTEQDWRNCPEGSPPETCDAATAVLGVVQPNVNSLIRTARMNIGVLEGMLEGPGIMANIDMAAAQWLSQVLCFLDHTVIDLLHWYALNKMRMEQWIELYFFMEEILSQWEQIKELFEEFESYCHDCRVDRGGLVMTGFNILMGIIPTPPMLRFPRLPDITVDLTNIKAGINIPIPRPDVHFAPIIFPDIPPLDLPASPSVDIILPGIPLIPAMEGSLPVPPFPEIPQLTLPDLPPPPLIPDLPEGLSEFMKIARPFLFIYCLFKNGIYPHPEMELKSVIEDLTSRPALRMFNFDFVGSLFEDAVIPSIRELLIELEINYDMDMGDSMITAMEAAIAPFNAYSTELWRAAEVQKRQMYDQLQILDLRDTLDPYSQSIRLGSPLSQVPSTNALADEEEKINSLTQDPRFKIQEANTPVDPVTAFIETAAPEISSIFSDLTDPAKFYQASELRAKYGRDPIRLPEELPAAAEIRQLSDEIAQMRDELLEEREVLLATNDLTRIPNAADRFASDSRLASAVEPVKVFAGLPEYKTQDSENKIQEQGVITNDELRITNYKSEGKNAEYMAQASQVLNLPNQENAIQLMPQGNSMIEREGYFAQCEANPTAEKIISSTNFSDIIEHTESEDLDLDGDEDLILITPRGIFLKENRGVMAATSHITAPPEIGDFVDFIPLAEAPKNVVVRSEADGVMVRFDAHFDAGLLGIEVIANDHSAGEQNPLPPGTTRLTALLLASRFMGENEDDVAFSVGREIKIGATAYSRNLMIKHFTKENVFLPLPEGKFWQIQVREIREGGVSTLSEKHLGAPAKGEDIFAPIILGDFQGEAVLYEELDMNIPVFDGGGSTQAVDADTYLPESEYPLPTITPTPAVSAATETPLEPVDDDENANKPNAFFMPTITEGVLLEWDFNGDGIIDATGDSVSFRPTTPGEYRIRLRATDASGNVSEEEYMTEVKAPEIVLDADALLQGIVSGSVEPKYAGVPFIIVRNRQGEEQKVLTPSAKNGRYVTEAFGRYRVDDFEYPPGARIKAPDGRSVAFLNQQTGYIRLEDPSSSLTASTSGGARIIGKSGELFGEIITVTDGNADVALTRGPITLEESATLSEGVYLSDLNTSDSFRAGLIPGDGPSFPGSAVISAGPQIVAIITPRGEIAALDPLFSFAIKERAPNEAPVILQLLPPEGEPVFDLFIKSDGKVLEAAISSEISTTPPSPEGIIAREFPASKPAVTAFPDVPESHPAHAAVMELMEKGMLSGFADGSFQPEKQITRAEFVKLVLAAAKCRECLLDDYPLQYTDTLVTPFPDIREDGWYAFCIYLAWKMGLINGYADGRFKPDEFVTRAEGAAILIRAAGIKTLTDESIAINDIPPKAWYAEDIATAAAIGLVSVHFGQVYPDEPLSRAEFALMAEKVMKSNRCAVPGPADPGVITDRCPAVPEDLDGVADDDGCPDFDKSEKYASLPSGMYVRGTEASGNRPILDFLADLMPGDEIFTGVVAEDGETRFSESNKALIPYDFLPQP